ncbi:alpha/beta fold hydrolase [Streptomyces sp. NPDC002730]|uniref:alpha/beta fold hydrolase n=1 Tax=Streptomyces sp. NPDC002730 TaxID=3364662 RepID=UPI0036D1EADC
MGSRCCCCTAGPDSAETRLLAQEALRLRAAYDGRIGLEMAEDNVRRRHPWGSEGGALGRGAAEATSDRADGSYRFGILQGAGHWLPEEVPDAVVPEIVDHPARNR